MINLHGSQREVTIMDPADITVDTHRSDAAAGHGKSKIASNPPEAGRVKEEFS